jgi:hypothetical protein
MAIERARTEVVVYFPLAAVKARIRQLVEEQHPGLSTFDADYSLVVSESRMIMTFTKGVAVT